MRYTNLEQLKSDIRKKIELYIEQINYAVSDLENLDDLDLTNPDDHELIVQILNEIVSRCKINLQNAESDLCWANRRLLNLYKTKLEKK